MPGPITEITEIVTALGTLVPNLSEALFRIPVELQNVPDEVWVRLVHAQRDDRYQAAFESAFANGVALLEADDGLRGRRPRLVEWKGPHRLPGDDVVPADLRIDHVYLVSCKYLSKVLLNAGPDRLFNRLLVGEQRAHDNWFSVVAHQEFFNFYHQARRWSDLLDLPDYPSELTPDQQHRLQKMLSARVLPVELQPAWAALCQRVAEESADRWRGALNTNANQRMLLWRLLRISNATYYVLGSDRSTQLRLRVASTWDWNQSFELKSLLVHPRQAGQPEVGWRAVVRKRADGDLLEVTGHVEVRWSHGRFKGWPEAKVYLDTAHASVPGYVELV